MTAETNLPTSISVVIPAYNSAATIGVAVHSVLAQSAAIQEIIVIDDGSTDETASIARELSELVQVITVPNGGPSHARNIGIANAHGDWIAFLDDDDSWHAEKLERQLRVLAAHPELDLVATAWSRSAPNPGPYTGSLTRLSYFSILLLNRFQTSTVLSRRSALVDTGNFDPELDGVEDWDYWMRFSKMHSLAILEEPLVLYRDSPQGVSKNLLRFYLAMRRMLQREIGAPLVDKRLALVVLAWHQLRLGVAFALEKDYRSALVTLRDLYTDGLLPSSLPAARRYLVPFLSDRVAKRLPRMAWVLRRN